MRPQPGRWHACHDKHGARHSGKLRPSQPVIQPAGVWPPPQLPTIPTLEHGQSWHGQGWGSHSPKQCAMMWRLRSARHALHLQGVAECSGSASFGASSSELPSSATSQLPKLSHSQSTTSSSLQESQDSALVSTFPAQDLLRLVNYSLTYSTYSWAKALQTDLMALLKSYFMMPSICSGGGGGSCVCARSEHLARPCPPRNMTSRWRTWIASVSLDQAHLSTGRRSEQARGCTSFISMVGPK